MGNFQAKIENNHVTKLHLNNKDRHHNDETSNHLGRYKKYLNDYGFYIISINSNLLKNKIKQSFRKIDLSSISHSDIPEDIIHMMKFALNEIDKVGDEKLGSIIIHILELASTYGFFSILDDPHMNSMNNADKLTKLKIVIPKILFNKHNQDFFDFITVHFINNRSEKLPDNLLNIIKHSLPNMLNEVIVPGKINADKNNFRFANILNILFNFALGLAILQIAYHDSKYKGTNIHEIAGDILGDLSKYIKDDECVNLNLVTSEVVDNTNLIRIEPNLCTKKVNLDLNKCPPVPSCPVCPACPAFPNFPTTVITPTQQPSLLVTPKILPESNSHINMVAVDSNNRTYMIVGIVVGIIILLIILYFAYYYIYPSTSSDTSEPEKETT
jgi:hypothetical protein